jgi:hypothetical protein
MERESAVGRALWLTLVVLLGGYVLADLVRSPFLAPDGSAAVRPAEMTLWSPAGEADGEAGYVVQGAAAAFELGGHRTATKSIAGGSSHAVADFLSHPPRDGGANLLVVTSATLADLARDRRDRLVPGAAEEAALARKLLRRATPIGLLESDPLAVAVARDSRIESSDRLLASLRSAPWQRIFGIADDTWSRVELAGLVDGAGVDGHVRFSTYHSGAEAGQAVQNGAANTVLAPRGVLRGDVRAGRLRELEWPLTGVPPRFWVALVAPPGAPRARATTLRRWVKELARDPVWRAQLRRHGRDSNHPAHASLATLLRGDSARADRLELLAQQVENR